MRLAMLNVVQLMELEQLILSFYDKYPDRYSLNKKRYEKILKSQPIVERLANAIEHIKLSPIHLQEFRKFYDDNRRGV